jgi:hypothetical protein
VDCDVLTDAEHEQKIVMLTTEPGSDDEAKFRQALQHANTNGEVAQTHF